MEQKEERWAHLEGKKNIKDQLSGVLYGQLIWMAERGTPVPASFGGKSYQNKQRVRHYREDRRTRRKTAQQQWSFLRNWQRARGKLTADKLANSSLSKCSFLGTSVMKKAN